jgi:hypothetical protein
MARKPETQRRKTRKSEVQTKRHMARKPETQHRKTRKSEVKKIVAWPVSQRQHNRELFRHDTAARKVELLWFAKNKSDC